MLSWPCGDADATRSGADTTIQSSAGGAARPLDIWAGDGRVAADRSAHREGITLAARNRLTAAESRFIRAQRVGRLATTDRAGHPHLGPVCDACDRVRFYTPLDSTSMTLTGRS